LNSLLFKEYKNTTYLFLEDSPMSLGAASEGTVRQVVPASRIALVTKANSDLPNGICRALLVGTPGTCNLMDAEGNTHADVPLQLGYNPISVKQIRTGGLASNIWALY
jgi:hypothetical protein